ncbi:MAG TPA: hypothetical protein PLE33_02800 [Candidatus Cloacimonas sp.]|jgi:hypothetical protein|nr:hypothetical protein [Candidatus Cloacimonas sp.]HNX02404.1 hypothetical protein [Candidatus Cloacimonas sp.]HPS60173.1 hypothetical protein [Candidatus Cloacimonas sp.]
MKVKFQYGLAGYTGKADGLVYCFDRTSGIVYARKKVYPRLTKENARIGNISHNLFSLKPANEYKDDLRLYLMSYNGLRENSSHPLRSWVNLYLRLMTNMAKRNPDIDLKTITRQQIYQENLPCISVKNAVEAGILPPVKGYERMTALI